MQEPIPVILASATALILGSASDGVGQVPRILPHTDDQVAVRSSTVATLSFDSLPIAPDGLARSFQVPGGGWGVSASTFGGRVQLFGADGEPSGSLGRRGSGPGEFLGPVTGIRVDDRLWLLDPRNNRATVYDDALTLVDSRSLPGRVLAATPSDDGGILASGVFPEGGGTRSLAFLTLDPSDDTFGGSEPSGPADIPFAAQAGNGEIWSVSSIGGRVSIYHPDGRTLIASYLLEGPDFEPKSARFDPSRERPPAQTAGVTADGDYVWIALVVADSQWEPGFEKSEGAARLFDTRVLRIAARERAIVGEGRFDTLCTPVRGADLACVDEIEQRITILRMR